MSFIKKKSQIDQELCLNSPLPVRLTRADTETSRMYHAPLLGIDSATNSKIIYAAKVVVSLCAARILLDMTYTLCQYTVTSVHYHEQIGTMGLTGIMTNTIQGNTEVYKTDQRIPYSHFNDENTT